MIAQTLTADPSAVPAWIAGAVAGLMAAAATASLVIATLKSLWTQVAGLIAAVRSTARGVELSRDDILAVLRGAFPDDVPSRLEAVADMIHERVTGRVRQVSTDAGTERVLKPIVQAAQAEIRKEETLVSVGVKLEDGHGQ